MINYFKYIPYLFVLYGFSVSIAGSYEDFFTAIKRDNPGTIRELLQRGFDPNTRDPGNQPGLYLALRDQSLKAAAALTDWPKTDVNALSDADESPLMIAVIKGNTDLVQRLLGRGADVNKPGWTPLHYAATAGNIALLNLLLEHHAYIDAESPNKTTPLMMAAHYGSTSAVKLLLDEGADPLLKNEQNLTALDFAQGGARPDAIALLSAAVRARQPKGKW